jgi:hypothetical protein
MIYNALTLQFQIQGGTMKYIYIVVVVFAIALTGACGGARDGNANAVATPVAANTDPALKTNIENALRQKGFNNVTVDVTTTPATLRGTYPKGRLAEVIQTAQSANEMKPLQNQMTEEN